MGAFDLQRSLCDYYIVAEGILPEAIRKTIRVKEVLRRGEARTVNEAVEKVSLSRSAFYKYKDFVFPFNDISHGKLVFLSFVADHRKNTLLKVMKVLSEASGNVMAVNQGIPVLGMSHVNISVGTAALEIPFDDLIDRIRGVDGVKRLRILGRQ